jgi:hypothetical protein
MFRGWSRGAGERLIKHLISFAIDVRGLLRSNGLNSENLRVVKKYGTGKTNQQKVLLAAIKCCLLCDIFAE